MSNVVIRFDLNQNAVFYPGQLLRGTIELFLDEPKKFNGLYIVVKGSASAYWNESVPSVNGIVKMYYIGEEIYLNSKTYLFGHSGASAVDVQPGTHRYDFQCQLPLMLPASFEVLHGHIRYIVEAVLDVPWWLGKEFKLPFTVIRNDNINDFPELSLPVQSEEIKRFGCYFCESQPMIMTVTLPCSGFTPGMDIPIVVKYDNMSGVSVKRTKINLIKNIRLTSHTPEHKYKHESSVLVEVNAERIGGNGTATTFTAALKLPLTLLSTNTRYCNVVRVSYELKVEAEVSACHHNVEIKIPITIL